MNSAQKLRLSFLIVFLYFGAFTDQNIARADTYIDNCDDPLDIENEHYFMTADIVTCVISANGVILDGQGLYKVRQIYASASEPEGNGYSITLQNLTIDGGGVDSEGSSGYGEAYDGGDGGDILIKNSTIDLGGYSSIETQAGDGGEGYQGGDGGSITIEDSVVTGLWEGFFRATGGHTPGGIDGNGGDITIRRSTFTEPDRFYISTRGARGGDILIEDSDLTVWSIVSRGNFKGDRVGGDGGDITIVRSRIVTGAIASLGYGVLAHDNTDYGGDAGNITITESVIEGDLQSYGGEGEFGNGTDGTIELINLPPTLEIDPEADEVAAGVSYDTMSGISAEDFVDGDLLEHIEVTGSVGDRPGEYELSYFVSDFGLSVMFNGEEVEVGPESSEGVRLVTRLEGGSSTSGGRSKTFWAQDNVVSIEQIINEIKKRVEAMLKNGETIPASVLSLFSMNSSALSVRDLERGMEGEDVRSLQSILISQGHSIPSGATGYFGSETKAALTAYQVANDILPATGNFGPVTRAFLKASGIPGLWW